MDWIEWPQIVAGVIILFFIPAGLFLAWRVQEVKRQRAEEKFEYNREEDDKFNFLLSDKELLEAYNDAPFSLADGKKWIKFLKENSGRSFPNG